MLIILIEKSLIVVINLMSFFI